MSREERLAVSLLQIALLAMPDTYYRTDRRCELARAVLSESGMSTTEMAEAILDDRMDWS